MKLSALLLPISAFPLACYLTLVASAVHTYFGVGHWPSYNNPDPHHLPVYGVACSAALAGLIGVVVCPLLALVIGCIRADRSASGFTVAGVCYAAGAIPWVLDFLSWRGGAGGLVNWIFD